MTITKAVELDLSKPLTVVFVAADRKEKLAKQSEAIRQKAEEDGYQVIEEFQALTFPKEANRDKVFLEAFTYLFNNQNLVQTLHLYAVGVLPEDSMSDSLRSLLRSQVGVDVLYAVDEDF